MIMIIITFFNEKSAHFDSCHTVVNVSLNSFIILYSCVIVISHDGK